MNRRPLRRMIAVCTALVMAATLASCASGGAVSGPIRVGWSGEVPPLDPAASDSFGSFAFLTQIYPSLLVVEAERPEPVPEIAESAEWTADGVYTVVLKPGLEFVNGNDLTTSDVKFSIERQLALQSEDGAWRLLANIESIDIVDDTTLEFRLDAKIDTGFPYVLAGPAGLVLDEEGFFADELTPDQDIVDAQPFAGPYALESLDNGELTLTPNTDFGGAPLAASPIRLTAGAGADLAEQLQAGSIDVLTGRLDPDTLESLTADEQLDRARAASGRVRMLAFDFAHMPFGSRTEAPDGTKALAVRTAISELVDRDALVEALGGNSATSLYGYVADGVPGAADVFTALHGDGEGAPDEDRAAAAFTGAGIEGPIPLSIHVDLEQQGVSASAEVAALADQLDDSGMFTVTVVETDGEGLSAALVAGETQVMFTSVVPTTGDPFGYLTPFRSASQLAPGYGDSTVDSLISRATTEADPDVRAATLLEAQKAIAAQLPAIPVTEGIRVVFVRGTISGFGVDDSLPLNLSLLRR